MEEEEWLIKLSTTDIAINWANIYFKCHFPQNSENLNLSCSRKKKLNFRNNTGPKKYFNQ